MTEKWIHIDEQMPPPGKAVIAAYKWGVRWRQVFAHWVPAYHMESAPDSEIGGYCEEDDCYYDPPGWYELIRNREDYAYIWIYEGDVLWWRQPPEDPPDETV